MRKFFSTIYSSPAKTLRAFCVFFMLGVALATTVNLQLVRFAFVLFVGIVIAATSAGIFWRHQKIRFVLLVLCAVAFGAWRVAGATAACLAAHRECTGKATVKVNPNDQSAYLKPIRNFASLVDARIKELWPGSSGALLAGVLYGEQSSLPREIKNNFASAGLTHILAVSGFNVTIVASALIGLTLAFGLHRRTGSYVSLGAIWLFVVFAGGSASAVRAGLMSTVVIAAERLGRLSSAGPALLFAGTFMVLQNPFTLLYNIGFQLSALATAGLIYGTPITTTWFEKLPYVKTNEALVEAAATTLAATIATLPIILMYFGRASPLSLVANVLVVPYMPFLMLVGFLALAASVVSFSLAAPFVFVAHWGAQYLFSVAALFGNPALSFTLYPPWPVVIAWYILLICYVQAKSKTLFIGQGVQLGSPTVR